MIAEDTWLPDLPEISRGYQQMAGGWPVRGGCHGGVGVKKDVIKIQYDR